MGRGRFIVLVIIMLVTIVPAVYIVNTINMDLFSVFMIGLAFGVISVIVGTIFLFITRNK